MQMEASVSAVPKRIFLKFEDVVKRAELNHSTALHDINELFLSKFELPIDLTHMLKGGRCQPLYVQDRQSQVWYQLEEISDIYENAVVELRNPITAGAEINHRMFIAKLLLVALLYNYQRFVGPIQMRCELDVGPPTVPI